MADATRRIPPLRTVVTGVASDAHTWNLLYLQLLLQELGHQVTNLGACVPEDLLAEHCLAERPDLVVVGTVNGHGVRDGLRLIAALRARRELARLPVVIGGRLTTDGRTTPAQVRRLLDAGFAAVFDGDAEITEFCLFVSALAMRHAAVP